MLVQTRLKFWNFELEWIYCTQFDERSVSHWNAVANKHDTKIFGVPCWLWVSVSFEIIKCKYNDGDGGGGGAIFQVEKWMDRTFMGSAVLILLLNHNKKTSHENFELWK